MCDMKMQPSREGRASAGKRGKEHAVKPGEMATGSDTAGQGAVGTDHTSAWKCTAGLEKPGVGGAWGGRAQCWG